MLAVAFLLSARGSDCGRVNNLVTDIGKEHHPLSIFFRLLDEGFSPQFRCLAIATKRAPMTEEHTKAEASIVVLL
jgi:hypothetical protein